MSVGVKTKAELADVFFKDLDEELKNAALCFGEERAVQVIEPPLSQEAAEEILARELNKLEPIKEQIKSFALENQAIAEKQGQLTDEERRAMYAEKHKDGSGITVRAAPTKEEKKRKKERIAALDRHFDKLESDRSRLESVSDHEENKRLVDENLGLRRQNSYLKAKLRAISALLQDVDL